MKTTTYVLWNPDETEKSAVFLESATALENGARMYVQNGAKVELEDAWDVEVYDMGIEIDTIDERFPHEDSLFGTAYKIVGDDGYLLIEGLGTRECAGKIISSQNFELLKIESDYVRSLRWMV